MRYSYNQRCDARLSALGAGTWSMGGRNDYGLVYGSVRTRCESVDALHALIKGGVNVIDTSPVYGVYGTSESLVGQALEEVGRDGVFLVTKFGDYCDAKTGARIIDNSREDILKEIEGSLERLNTSYIDLYLMHYPDPKVPVSETMQTLNELKEQGRIRHIGVSNVTLEQLKECMEYAQIDALQVQYSMLQRSAEPLLKWAHAQGLMTMTYGSLGGGMLSGAFRTLPSFSEKDVRYTFYPYFKEPLFSKIQGLLDDMDVVAARHDVPVSHVALAWTAQKGFVTTALVGSGTVRSAKENCKAFELELAAEETRFLDESIERHLSA